MSSGPTSSASACSRNSPANDDDEEPSDEEIDAIRYPAFAESIREVASTHIRNMATLGGNICLQTRCAYTNNSEEWRKGLNSCYKTEGKICHVIKSSSKCLAINNADTPVALIMLGAVLTIQSTKGSREVPIASCASATRA